MKEVELFLGRCQPVHLGHAKIIAKMTNPVIVLVKGNKSSQNRKRNPFSEEYQKKLFRLLDPNLEIEVSPNGFLPGIISYLKEHGKKVTKIYCGADRIDSYRKAIELANEKYDIVFQETERNGSGSEVRTAIRNNDFETFKTLMPERLHQEFRNMKDILQQVEILSFEEWLKEETGSGGVSTTLTPNVAKIDIPMKEPLAKRKQSPEEADQELKDTEEVKAVKAAVQGKKRKVGKVVQKPNVGIVLKTMAGE